MGRDSDEKVIYHYINLVCWREFFEHAGEFGQRTRIYCDSLSMLLVCKLLGATGIIHKTGSTEIPRLKELMVGENLTVLSPYSVPFFQGCEIVVPPDLTNVSDYALEVSECISHGHTVAIGLSSPKQNFLGTELIKLRPDLEVICVGAVIPAFASERYRSQVERRSNSGYEWCVHLARQPRRGLKKIAKTIRQALNVLLLRRGEFLRFARHLERK